MPNDRALAHVLLRVTLGINICLHGVQRFSGLEAFAGGVIKNFSGILPTALVAPYAYALPFAEALIGALLIAGYAQRAVLVAGAALMASLTFGMALRGQHDVLAEQLGYELTYFVLLATLSWDRFSIDARIARDAPPTTTTASRDGNRVSAGR